MPAQEPTSDHPTQVQLSDFSEGRLEEADAREVEGHVMACDICAMTMLELKQNDTLIDLLGQLGEVDEISAITTTQHQVDASSTPLVEQVFQRAAKVLENHARYEWIRPIGRGGMGEVVLARHRVMDRNVAIKFISEPLLRQKATKTRGPISVSARGTGRSETFPRQYRDSI